MGTLFIFFIFAAMALSFRQTTVKLYAIASTGLLIGAYILRQQVLFVNGRLESWDKSITIASIALLLIIYIIYLLILWSIAWRNKKLHIIKEANAIKYGMISSFIILVITIMLCFFLP